MGWGLGEDGIKELLWSPESDVIPGIFSPERYWSVKE